MEDPAPPAQAWAVELGFGTAHAPDRAAITELARHGVRSHYSEPSQELYTRVDTTAVDGADALARAADLVTGRLTAPGTLDEARVVRRSLEMRRALRGYRGRLATLTDAAKLMEVSEHHARAILDRPDAPRPLDITSAGPIWNAAEVVFYRLQRLLVPRTRRRDAD